MSVKILCDKCSKDLGTEIRRTIITTQTEGFYGGRTISYEFCKEHEEEFIETVEACREWLS